MSMKFTDPKGKVALSIASQLIDEGHEALFAGGCVRDALLNCMPIDFDIATSALPDEVEKLFPHTVPIGKQFGVILVVMDKMHYEVATFRHEGPYKDGRHPEKVSFTSAKEDALRRDFTINGLFYDPQKKKVLDFVGGEQDLSKRVIRAIGNPEERFQEDKLRLLRAVRFASSLGFEIEDKTWKALRKLSSEILVVSPERIRDELIKIFTRPGARRGFYLLSECGLMKQILPEFELMKDCDQQPDYHPEGDVFTHTGLLLEKLKGPSLTLALGALFHDIAKPQTHAIRNGKITFYQHAPIGAKMTQEVMKRLRFSNDQIHDVAECVDNHMKFADVQKMRSGKLKKFVSRPTFMEELELHRIDCLSSHGMLDNYYFLKEKLKEYAHEDLKPEPFITGHDLIELGMKPGPKMKPVLENLYELQLENKFKDKSEALKMAKNMLCRDSEI